MKKSKTFKLHYIGKGLYTITIFETEAKKYGVQRAISFSQLKTLKFGTPILLATYSTQPKTKSIPSIEKEGIAEVFGYFTLDGISHNLNKEISKSLNEKLHIIKVDNNSFSISRACGSYSIGGIAYIKEDLKTLLEKVEEIFTVHNSKFTDTNHPKMLGSEICTCLKCKKKTHTTPEVLVNLCLDLRCDCCTHVRYGDIDSHKWFINGKYHPLTPFLLTPAKFSRGIQTVTVDGLELGKQSKTTSALVWLYNYRQRHYLPKIMKNNLQTKTNPFKNVF